MKRRALSILFCLTFLAGPGGEAKSSSALVQQGQAQLDAGNYGKVFSLLQTDSSAESSLIKGKALLSIDSDHCGQYFGRATEAAPNSAEAHIWYGIYWMQWKHYRQARQELAKALSLDPASANAHAAFGRCLFRLGQVTDGMAEMHKAIALDPKSLLGHEYLADSYADQLNQSKAVAELTKLITIYPTMPILRVLRAKLYSESGDQQAFMDYAKAVELNPQFDYAYVQRADLLMTKAEYKKAVADLVRPFAATNIEELQRTRYYIRVRCYERLGEYKNAVADWNVLLKDVAKIKRLEAGWIKNGLLERAQDYLKIKDYQQALADVKLLQRFEPESRDALVLTAKIHSHSGQYQTALDDYNKMIAIDNGIPEWWRERAEILKKLGKTEASQLNFKKAKELEDGM